MANLPAAALDATVLRELSETLGGRLDVIASLYGRFLEHASGYLCTLRDHAGGNSAMTLHTLKGSAAMMGAIRISALAAQLHETYAHCPTPPPGSAICRLESELEMFRRALATHLDAPVDAPE